MSLRSRLLGLVLLASLLPAVLLGWRFMHEREAEIGAAVKLLGSAANHIATDLDHRVQGTAQLHYGLAHSRMLDQGDRVSCSSYLATVRQAYSQYTGILTVTPDGQLHCDSLQSGRALDLRDRAYFKRAQAGRDPLILEPTIGRLTGNTVLQIVHPARDAQGAMRFLLVASLNLTRFAADARLKTPHPDTELVLLDDRGSVLAWVGAREGLPKAGTTVPDRELLELARRHRAGGTGEIVAIDGQRQVWAVGTSPTVQAAGMHVLLGLPRQALVADAEQRLRDGLGAVALLSLLLFAAVWALAEWGIRRQVGRISTMLADLGRGQLGTRIDPPHPRGELGGLMLQLNSTADSLEQQHRAIDELGRRLARMANFDSLTGMPNRTLFRDRLEQAMARARRSGQPFALMFLDLDRFKNVNDSLGHDIGDRLLVSVAGELARCLRGSDSIGRPAETAAGAAFEPATAFGVDDETSAGVFRLGGDEFMILAEDLRDADAAALIARRLLGSLKQPFIVGEHELFISGSLGITVYAGSGTDPDGLIKQADLAMYRAKQLGRDTYFFFDQTLNEAAATRHQLEVKLRHALARGEFRLHYQPKAELRGGRISGVEALLRWQPEGEPMVGPDRFIPILEETGLIVEVGAWIFHEACAQVVAWQREGLPPLNLAINLSARQFRQADLLEHIARVLADTGLPPRQLEVELTESLLIDNSDAVMATLAGLEAMGVSVAVDDFGTGYSSLSYLKRFNVDKLKIDRSFVQGIPGDAEDSAIARAVIALGHGLGLQVVAEGVETEQQAEHLRTLGCDEYQGYLLSKPVDPTTFGRWYAAHCAAAVA